ncbi:AraC family transcriptional regulator [Paenibacillus roseipurpureus]|uniref:AraC family transcriptional regulator n=1 Tax=Paenibacillus roseopurpureus TaxID=2918901 RepID=A0AA96LNP0_9BACL|nr:AraC family transcriptional regulator [Paenibacillus sp. MBLB1832]WNR44384.1 AraC family transcriptional regulator [Paenibacillus sp. MBLB1832]
MTSLKALKENTRMPGKHFLVNVFHNLSSGERVLYPHWHEHLEIIYVVKGNAVFDIGGITSSTSPGDLLFVHSGELHSGYAVNNMDVDYYAIVFNKSLLGADSGDPLYGPMVLPFMEGRKRFPLHVRPEDEVYPAFAEIIHRLIDEFEHKQPGYELSVRSHLQLLITATMRLDHSDSLRKEVRANHSFPHAKYFEKLFAFVREEYKRPIPLEEAAQLTNMSLHHFCKTFKKITGRTFVEYVNLYRINAAEQLLRTEGVSVTEAAELVGFNSINYFTRTFKQFKYYSPSQCKRE